MIKILSILFLFQIFTQQPCVKGCLKCGNESTTSTTKKCFLCDQSLKYYLKGNECAISDLTNCQAMSQDGACLLCIENYYLDTTTKKCVAVPTANLKTNCKFYSSATTCVLCAPDYLIEAGACVKVTTAILNCALYESQTFCAACKYNYYVSDDKKSCVSNPSLANCLFYSRFKCVECKSDYFLEKNYYFESFQFDNTDARDNFIANISLQKDGYTEQMNVPICKKATVSNCAELEDYNKCKTCFDGYFLSDQKACIQFPFEKVDNCKIYSSLTVCIECNSGFYRKSNQECAAVTSITNCDTYNSYDINNQSCIKCQAAYYLNGNACTLRVVKDTNCATFSVSQDICAVCKAGFQLSTSKDLCAALISNCLVMVDFVNSDATANPNTLKCATCSPKYFVNANNLCEAGTVTNCAQYNTNQNVCNTCENKFFTPAGGCTTSHPNLDNCSIYSQTEQKECITCNTNFVSLHHRSKCVNQTIIQNCAAYNDERTQCTQCNDNYYLSNATTCTALTKSCKTATSQGVCTVCNAGLSLAKDKDNVWDCIADYAFNTDQCGELSNDYGINDKTCNYCKPGAYPYTPVNVCIEDTKLKYFNTKLIIVKANCAVYADDNGFYCARCKQNYILGTSGECVTNYFQSTSAAKITFFNWNNGYKEQIADNDNGWVKVQSTDANDIFIKCKKFVQVIDFTNTDKSNIRPSSVLTDNWVLHPLDYSPKVSCPAFVANTDKFQGNANAATVEPTTDIGLYQQYLDPIYFQINCGFQQSGKSIDATSNGITSCASIANCENTRYYNIPHYWNYLLSCYKCTNTSTDKSIPVLSVEATFNDGDNGKILFSQFKWYNFSNPDWFNNVTSNTTLASVTCRDISTVDKIKSSLNVTGTDTVIALPTDCAFALLNLSVNGPNFDNSDALTSPITATKRSLVCLACKPNKKPTWDSNTQFVTACADIANCDTTSESKVINGCQKCSSGYAHKYDNNEIQWDTCIQLPTGLTNCLVYDTGADANTVGKCQVCDIGYNRTSSFYCEKVTVANCAETNSVIQYDDDQNGLVPYLTYLRQFGGRCSLCSSGFSSVYNVNSQTVCFLSDFTPSTKTTYQQPTDESTLTGYIQNCIQYRVDKNCKACATGFILKSDYTECISQTLVQNCEIAADNNNCTVCRVGFALVSQNGKNSCLVANIENCDEYYIDEVKNLVQCKTCKNEFYKDTNDTKCLPGYIQQCLVYRNKEECDVCKTGYWPLTSTNDTNDKWGRYCVSVTSSSGLNCGSYLFTEGTSGLDANKLLIDCDSCNQPYGKKTTVLNSNSTDIISSCSAVNAIPNCKTLSTDHLVNDYSFVCVECELSFYLTNNNLVCKQRENQDVQCAKFSKTQDICQECNANYFLSNDNKTCIAYPTGIVGCEIFSNLTTCTKCKPLRYLTNNTCLLVLDTKKITDCLYYKSDSECQTCKPNYYLGSSNGVQTCSVATIQNCAVLEATDSCSTCNYSYQIEVVNSKKQCKLISISNCDLIDSATAKCSQCKQNFYIDPVDGTCKQGTIISGCLINQSDKLCKKCVDTSALSTDQTKCITNTGVDSNCNEQVQPSGGECTVCKGGYWFQNNACQEVTQNKISTGCFSTDIVNKDQSKCVVCYFGYYMDTNGKCNESNPASKPTTNGGFILMILNFITFLALF